MKALLAIAAALTMLASAGAAVAASYSGNWPLTVTHSKRSDGTYCLTLTDADTRPQSHRIGKSFAYSVAPTGPSKHHPAAS